jgi:lysophospholipase L1-like esterase
MSTSVRNDSASPYCRALAWITVAGARRPILPAMAVKYLLILLACVLAVAALVEARLRLLASHGEVASFDWQVENENIARMNAEKVLSTFEDPLWRSAGMPLHPKAAGVRRILVIGDSFVWGDGSVNANEIWWRQLQRELERRGYRNIEVVAAGWNGASTQDELNWLRERKLLEQAQPDLVIFGYVTNDADVRRPDGTYYVKQIGRDVKAYKSTPLSRLSQIAPNLAYQLQLLRARKWEQTRGDAYPYAQWEMKLLESPNLDAYGEVLKQVEAFFAAERMPLFFVALPNFPSSTFEPRYRPVAPLFQQAGLTFHNLLDDFIREFPSDTVPLLKWGVNPVNGHPGPTSTRFYARKTADILERDYPSVLGQAAQHPAPLRAEINDWMPPASKVQRVGPTDWQLVYPVDEALMPVAPLGKRHVVLSFEQPVAIRSVHLEGERLQEAELYSTVVDPASAVERPDPEHLGRKTGSEMSWTLTGDRPRDPVNTLQLVALVEQAPALRVALTTAGMQRDSGSAYAVQVPQLRDEADTMSAPNRSPWRLEEDGRPLKRPHTNHEDIRSKGRGRWSHWDAMVLFSASDGSDPRTNGRRYELVKPDAGGRTLRLHIDFEQEAVRP